jgi:hypothetical protein
LLLLALGPKRRKATSSKPDIANAAIVIRIARFLIQIPSFLTKYKNHSTNGRCAGSP